MAEKKGSTVLLTVIGIATLLVTLVGATFAYFTADVQGNYDDDTSDVTITAANLGTIVYNHSDTISLENAYPGATDSIDFSVQAADSATSNVNYDVYLIVTANTFETTNLVGTLTAPTSGTVDANFPAQTALDSTNFATSKEVKIGNGVLAPKATDNWNLSVLLKEMGGTTDQNADQGKTFTARVEIRVQGEGQYTQDSVYGGAQAS